MAVAIPQAVDPSYLLQQSQWQPEGWSIVERGVVRKLDPMDVGHTQLDCFEWVDVAGLGISAKNNALQQLADGIAQQGSALYGYALFKRQVVNVNVLGIPIAQAWSYRLLLLHSQIQLLGWAVFILAAAFAAVIFIQYITMGRSPALEDLRQFWSGIIKAAGDAGGAVVGAATNTFVFILLAAGAASIAFALAAREAGVPNARAPRAKLGADVGPFGGEVGL